MELRITDGQEILYTLRSDTSRFTLGISLTVELIMGITIAMIRREFTKGSIKDRRKGFY